MSNDDRTVRGTISTKADCKERVAYDLMIQISYLEEKNKAAPRRYWLDLYHHCWNAVHGSEPDKNLQEFPSRG